VTVFERFTNAARKAVVLAQEWAVEQRHAGITPGALLVGVAGADGGSGAAALADLELPADRVKRAVLAVQPAGSEAPAERLPFTPGAKRVLEFSLREALRLDDREIDSGHLLLGLLASADDDLDRVLAEAGTDAGTLRQATERRLAARPKVEQPPVERDPLLRIEALLSAVLARLERIERRLDRS
jgi:ATP-dependent Clp protease ATP-binding subunit ClpC